MQTRVLLVLLLIGFLTACSSPNPTQTPTPDPTQTSTPFVAAATATPQATASVLEEPEPSYKVAAFYYPWYENPEIDGEWIHWTQNDHFPPEDIAADYYPALGVTQHMEWL